MAETLSPIEGRVDERGHYCDAMVEEWTHKVQKDIDALVKKQEEYQVSLDHIERLRIAQMAFLEEHEEVRQRASYRGEARISLHEMDLKKNSPPVRRSSASSSVSWEPKHQKSHVVNHHPRVDHRMLPEVPGYMLHPAITRGQ